MICVTFAFCWYLRFQSLFRNTLRFPLSSVTKDRPFIVMSKDLENVGRTLPTGFERGMKRSNPKSYAMFPYRRK